jgi:hypothetical protein
MAEYISLLLNINLLFFSFSFAIAFSKISGNDFKFRQRIKALESIFSFSSTGKKSKSKIDENKRKFIESVSFFIVLISFTILTVFYLIMFYDYILNNYDDRFWYVFRLIFSPFVFLIIPLFLPSILENFLYGFFKYEFGKTNTTNPNLYKYSFAFDWIWVLILLTILTLFVSWEVDIVWLGLLIIELVLLIIIGKIFSSKRSKLI